MRYLFVLAALLAGMAVTTRADEPGTDEQESGGNPRSVRFDGQSLALASHEANDTLSITEYIPEGESLETWTRLAAIHEYPNLNDPKEVAESLVRTLEQRTPPAPNDIIQDKKTGDVIVDFIVWPEGSEKPEDAPYVEFNIFKYSKKDGGGLVAYQYAVRAYRDIPEFLGGLRPVRDRLIDAMAKDGLTGEDTESETQTGDTSASSDEASE